MASTPFGSRTSSNCGASRRRSSTGRSTKSGDCDSTLTSARSRYISNSTSLTRGWLATTSRIPAEESSSTSAGSSVLTVAALGRLGEEGELAEALSGLEQAQGGTAGARLQEARAHEIERVARIALAEDDGVFGELVPPHRLGHALQLLGGEIREKRDRGHARRLGADDGLGGGRSAGRGDGLLLLLPEGVELDLGDVGERVLEFRGRAR